MAQRVLGILLFMVLAAQGSGETALASSSVTVLQTGADQASQRTSASNGSPNKPDLFRALTDELSRGKPWYSRNEKGRRMGECCETYGCTTCNPGSCTCSCNLDNYECQCLCSALPPGQQAVCLQQCYLEETCCYASRCGMGSC